MNERLMRMKNLETFGASRFREHKRLFACEATASGVIEQLIATVVLQFSFETQF